MRSPCETWYLHHDPPGVRHRAIGQMKVLIVVLPKFDTFRRMAGLTERDMLSTT
jgi:hypothetical protein